MWLSSGETEGTRIWSAGPLEGIGPGGTLRWFGTGLRAGSGRSGGSAGEGEGFCAGVGWLVGGAAVCVGGSAGEGAGTVDGTCPRNATVASPAATVASATVLTLLAVLSLSRTAPSILSSFASPRPLLAGT